MDWETEIAKVNGKSDIHRLAQTVIKHPVHLASLMNAYFHGHWRITQTSSWILSHIADQHVELLAPYLPEMVSQLTSSTSNAVKRNTVRILQHIEISEDLQGEVLDICFKFLLNPNEAVAVRVFSMTVLHRLTTPYPELRKELATVIEAHLPYGTAGFKSRGKKILKELRG